MAMANKVGNPVIDKATIGFKASTFTRMEFHALKAHIQGVPLQTINHLYLPIKQHELDSLKKRAVWTFYAFNKSLEAANLSAARSNNEDSLKRAFDALRQLESLATSKPELDHLVGLWFIPALSKRLTRNSIETIKDLLDVVNEHGAGFWRKLDRIGQKAGEALVRWIAERVDLFDYRFRDFVTAPLPSPISKEPIEIGKGSVPVPFERMVLPSPLSGISGNNRGDKSLNRLSRDNDFEAINIWLSRFDRTSHTYRAYKKEAERLVLWSVIERDKPVSSLDFEDVIAYKEFLGNPTPREKWVAPPSYKRFSKDWRPFAGPLSPTSKQYALTVLSSMCEFLWRQNYLASNPFDGLPPSPSPRMLVEKALPEDDFKQFLSWLSKKEDHSGRTVYIAILLMARAGLRREEVCNLKRKNLVFDKKWVLRFEGKGGRYRVVPLPNVCINAIKNHLLLKGYNKFEVMVGDIPILSPEKRICLKDESDKRQGKGYTGNGLWRLIKSALSNFSEREGLEEGIDISDSHPHAFRHTFGMHAVKRGMDLTAIQKILGHRSVATTTIYTQGDIEYLHQQSELLNKDD